MQLASIHSSLLSLNAVGSTQSPDSALGGSSGYLGRFCMIDFCDPIRMRGLRKVDDYRVMCESDCSVWDLPIHPLRISKDVFHADPV
jgi:hypothetical protein